MAVHRDELIALKAIGFSKKCLLFIYSLGNKLTVAYVWLVVNIFFLLVLSNAFKYFWNTRTTHVFRTFFLVGNTRTSLRRNLIDGHTGRKFIGLYARPYILDSKNSANLWKKQYPLKIVFFGHFYMIIFSRHWWDAFFWRFLVR